MATLLGAIVILFTVFGLLAWTSVVPRSGGIYVFLSRSGLPWLGFALSFVEAISWIFYAAVAARTLVTAIIVPGAFFILGPSSALVSQMGQPIAQFIMSTTLIILAVVILLRGTKSFLISQNWTFVIAVVGTIAVFLALAIPGAKSIFQNNINEMLMLGGVAGTGAAIASAEAAGWVAPGPASFAGSVALLVWPVLPLIGAGFSIAFGGEIRNTVRAQTIGMVGSLIASTLAFILIAELAASTVTNAFQGAAAFLADNHQLNLGGADIALDPNIVVFSSAATNSTLLRILIFIGFAAWIWFWLPGLLAYSQRCVLAWALDRAVPAVFGELHARYGTPYIATLAVGLTAIIFIGLITWTEYFATLVFILAGAMAWSLALFFGIFFPYVRRNLFNRGPLGSQWERGRLIMATACGAGTAAMWYVCWLLFADPLAAGDLSKGFTIIGVLVAAAGLIFLYQERRLRRTGITLRHAYDEIPVE